MIRQRTAFRVPSDLPVNKFQAPENPVYRELIINSQYMPRAAMKQAGLNPEGSNNG